MFEPKYIYFRAKLTTMKKILVICLASVLFSCKGTKPVSEELPDFVIDNTAKVSSPEMLEKKYPNGNIVNGKSAFEEGTAERDYSLLYQSTKNEAVVTWKNGKVYDIAVSGNGDWRSKNGIAVGTTYEELVHLNKKPIRVYGFGWDYSGAVDWNGGKMEKSKVQVFLSPTGEIPEKFYGDQIISPTEGELKKMNLKVSTILYKAQND